MESRLRNPDRAIVDSQRPERLPLDLLEELHLPFERLAIAYRRRLAEIGVSVPAGRRTERASCQSSPGYQPPRK